jgi:predicted NAD-dependent protein-ADP-ribosyltransferase YbiA (DUF1768 family)
MWPRIIDIDRTNWTISKDECLINNIALSKPMIYINKYQYEKIKNKQNDIMLCDDEHDLPCWKPVDMVAAYFDNSDEGIQKAVPKIEKNFMWATEFENTHENWDFVEMPIKKGVTKYNNAEEFYQTNKPSDDNDFSENATKNRNDVMSEAVYLKFVNGQNSDHLMNLLVSTYPHDLVCANHEYLSGMGNKAQGQNSLIPVLLKLRDEFVLRMRKQLETEWRVDHLWKCYLTNYLPPEWARTDYKKYFGYAQDSGIDQSLIPQYFTTSDHDENLDLVIHQRVPTNISNQNKFHVNKMEKYFGYSESGYDKAFKDSNNKVLPPNFGLLCSATVENNQVDRYMASVHNGRKCVIRVMNSIGFAFDDETQSDYIYFIDGKRMNMFQDHLENMILCIFAAYDSFNFSMLVLSEVGGGEFSAKFEGGSEAYLKDYFYPALTNVYKSRHAKPAIILLMGSTDHTRIDRLEDACPDSTVLGCGRFPHIVTQYVQHTDDENKIIVRDFSDKIGSPAEGDIFYISEALFVNAWDPHSLVGNGNAGDDSLDGYIGRNTNMALMSFPRKSDKIIVHTVHPDVVNLHYDNHMHSESDDESAGSESDDESAGSESDDESAGSESDDESVSGESDDGSVFSESDNDNE